MIHHSDVPCTGLHTAGEGSRVLGHQRSREIIWYKDVQGWGDEAAICRCMEEQRQKGLKKTGLPRVDQRCNAAPLNEKKCPRGYVRQASLEEVDLTGMSNRKG